MSIDKNSTGFPEVNLHKKTTQVNVVMVGVIVLFLLGASAIAFWASRQLTPPAGAAPSKIEHPAP